VGFDELLHRGKEDRNILHSIHRKEANWIGQILRRNYILKYVTTKKRGKTGKKMLAATG
jgi:hypothetical protein